MKLVLAFGFLCAWPVLVQAQIAPIENRVPRPARLVFALPDPLRELGAAPSFPIPPAQNAPWNGTADAFGTVVKRMFDAGLADPRGLEYREVDFIAAPASWRAPGEVTLSARGFVLPSSDPNAPFAIAWDGQIYRVSRVGELKNALADFAALKQKPLAGGERFAWWNPATQLDLQTPTVLKAVLAERLGAPRSLYSEIQLKGAAFPFVTQLSNRARSAHLRGDDQTALALLRKERLARESLRDVFPLKTEARNSEFQSNAPPDDDQLLADQERREKERLAAPIGVHDTPLQRLIDDLQNVNARQMSVPGSVNFLDDERVRSLVEMGEGAVPALIEVVASDNRLTRSFEGRGFGSNGQILPVSMAAYDALMEIWGVRRSQSELFGDRYELTNPQKRAETVAKLRAYAAKGGAMSPLERQFAVLGDAAATPLQWLDVINSLNRAPGQMTYIFVEPQPGARLVPGRGEPLRTKTNPSVSDLVERRALQVSQQAVAAPLSAASIDSISTGDDLLMQLAKWDLPRALPLFLPQIGRIQALENTPLPEADARLRSSNAGLLDFKQSARRLEADARLRFLNAALSAPAGTQRQRITGDYAAWLQSQPFGSLDSRCYSPLKWTDEPALARAAQSLFGAPRKPFEESLLRAKTEDDSISDSGIDLLDSNLLRQKPFRNAVLRELGNQTPVAKLRWQGSTPSVRLKSGALLGDTLRAGDLSPRAENGAPLRVCDVVASGVYGTSPSGEYEPSLHLWWPQARRDTAIALLKKRLENNAPFELDGLGPLLD